MDVSTRFVLEQLLASWEPLRRRFVTVVGDEKCCVSALLLAPEFVYGRLVGGPEGLATEVDCRRDPGVLHLPAVPKTHALV